MPAKLLIVDVAALGYDLLRRNDALELDSLRFRPAETVYPAVTCTAQGSFRTASGPGEHGMIANGLYHRQLRKPMFWEQSSALVTGRRIWQRFAERGNRTAMLFWQQSLGEQVDFVLSPAPIHKHHGGIIMDCYSQPGDLYRRLCKKLGKKFPLHRYWGPMASAKVGDWIAAATAEIMAAPDLTPELVMTYLPSLDYDLQRHGPAGSKASAALAKTREQLNLLLQAARQHEYEVVIFGDYAIAPTNGPAVYPNRTLAEAGLFQVRTIAGMQYPDFHTSRAFAVVDHEIAHVYVPNPADVARVQAVLAGVDGVESVLTRQTAGFDHPHTGELIIQAAEGRWLAYPWWTQPKNAPDYARHIDIHNKPGYDPCELFLQILPPGVSQDTAKISGSHGRANGPGRQIAWASTITLSHEPANLIELAAEVQTWLEGV
ncbi:MAG: alkaline phosphatase family protein [Phycisphaerae bacterium]|nr:alkaline phosphatase family protein [Phycisphaerae bacterium]